MPINPARLPQGAKLPPMLTELDARDLVATLAEHFGWAYALFSREDVEEQLTGNLDRPPGRPPTRRLTDEEWARTRTTVAWKNLPRVAARAVDHASVIADVIRQAALECAACDAPLTGPPTATWGHCPACLNRADIANLRRQPCAAAGADVAHDWGANTCRACGLPRVDQSTSSTRRLTAVPDAA